MSETPAASEESKTSLENTVAWFLADKLADPSTTIATKKYMTSNNLLVYLTQCNVAETAIPRIKVQVLQRVDGGIHETGYHLYGDHRLEKYENDMIFGGPIAGADTAHGEPVGQPEAEVLLQLLASLQDARQTV